MADAMVVARMPQEKKASVAKKLDAMNLNASKVINQLYDYIDAKGCLPFEQQGEDASDRMRKAQEARGWLRALTPLPEGNIFQHAGDDDIRRMRLAERYGEF